jgi:acetyl-CoA synthetase
MSFKINNLEDYHNMQNLYKSDANKFWENIANEFYWEKKWDKICETDFDLAINKWFLGGRTNITYNIFDRNLNQIRDKIAFYLEENEESPDKKFITYGQLFEDVCQFANYLKAKNISKADVVTLYMPMIYQAVVAMLACSRIGAIHNVVFAGFSASSLAERIADSNTKLVITADFLYRGEKKLCLIDNVYQAISTNNDIPIIMYQRSKQKFNYKNLFIWQAKIANYATYCDAEFLDSEDILFLLYTSGSTGKPKGIKHANAGYMVYTAYSFLNVFQYSPNDIFFCSADIGWITGHSYLVYGPLLTNAQIILFEGVPTYPKPSRFFDIIDKYKVNIFYTAPTAIRSLMLYGDDVVSNNDLSSLRVIGSVGEPINKEAWNWYYHKVGKTKSALIDSWWQTETGGIMISPLAGIISGEATFATKPLPGITPVLLDDNGVEITEANVKGNLCFSASWPSIARSIHNDHARFISAYFAIFKGYYFSGDAAYRSVTGDYRIIGRVDDVINSSGHRIGSAELENVINSHDSVIESAVISFKHDIKGEGIFAFIIANNNIIEADIIEIVKRKIGSFAKPDKVRIVSDLPKTRSGKIVRRLLKKIISGDENLGDLSTVVNPEIISELKEVI